MNIKGIITSGLICGAALFNNSCKTQETKYTESWVEGDRTELYNNITKNRLQSPIQVSSKSIAEMQHEADCLIFQDMFTGTQLAKNSKFVNDYNRMLQATKVEKNAFGKVSTKAIDKKLAQAVSTPVAESLGCLIPKNKGTEFIQASKEFLVDSVYHYKLFKKYNLLNENGLKTFKNLCKRVKP